MSDSAAPVEPGSPSDPAPTSPAPPGTPRGLSLGARLGIGVLVVCAGAALFWPRGSETSVAAGSLYDIEGQSTTLGPHLQPVTLVHFWATWCGPCLQEVPALRRLANDFSGKHEFGVVMIAVNDSREKVRTFLGADAAGSLLDPNWEVARRYGTTQVPETYLVVNGKVVQKFVGLTNWDDPAVRARLESAHQQATSGTGA